MTVDSGAHRQQRTVEVVRGVEEAARVSLRVFHNAQLFFQAVSDWRAPSLAVEVEIYRNAYLDMMRRGVRVRAITEITKENLEQCKQLLKMGLVTELRHLSGSRGNFAITEREYIATPVIKETKPATEVIYSNDEQIVEQNRYVFDVLWEKAVPAELRIMELEDRIDLGYVLLTYDRSDMLSRFREFVESTRHDALIIIPSEAAMHSNIEQFRTLARKAREEGVHVNILISAPLGERKKKNNNGADLHAEELVEKYDLQGVQFRFAEKISSNFSFGIYDRKKMIAVHYMEPPTFSQESKSDGQRGTHYVATITTNGETVGGMASIFDALWQESELREREEKSRKRAELLQDILTHDIRNYNQVIKLSAELLKDELEGHTAVQPITDSLLRAVEESTRLVSRARDFGRVLSEVSPKLYAVSIADPVKNAMDLVKRAHPEKIVDYTETFPVVPPMALADELLLQVFVNIYSNAVKYTEGRAVSVETRIEQDDGLDDGSIEPPTAAFGGSYWKVSVSDHGRGISEDLKELLFKRYLQSAKGSGLGMSIVHALVVERYHGRVRIRDRVPGDHTLGTVVELWLPQA